MLITRTRSLLLAMFSLLASLPFNTAAATNSNTASINRPLTNAALLTCPIPNYSKIQPVVTSTSSQDIAISSNQVSMRQDKFADFIGDVTLTKADRSIKAKQLSFNRDQNSLLASGDIHFQSSSIDVFAKRLFASESNGKTELDGASYQLAGNPGHGSAKQLSISLNGNLVLTDSTFTTCYGETPDWQIAASEIEISAEENIGRAYHAKFKVFDVPVFYLPYFTFPVSDKRESGFLYPSISSSQNSGLTIATPYYWNIASNYDATFTPRYMSKRGTQLITEFRYLADQQGGIIDLEYLHKDDELAKDSSNPDSQDARYLARVQHAGTFSDRFRVYVDYTKISDNNYLIDIGSKHYNANDAYLYQIGELAYFADTWQLKAKLQDFDILGDSSNSYKTLPQIEFNSQTLLGLANASFDLYSELSYFQDKNTTGQDAQRYHVEAGFNLPFNRPAWFFNSELKVLQTHFRQENLAADSSLAKTVNRTLPKVRLHAGINFDRSMKLAGYTQTLEPQMQYLYIPEKDQTDIGIYDTNLLQDDYDGLFRDRRVSGLDRIIQANQVSWGVTSRILDPHNSEVFRFSLGKIVYFNNSNEGISEQQGLAVDSSALAAEAFFRINRQWQFSADIQYNTEDDLTNKSQVNIDYYFSNNGSIQLNHRYNNDVSGVNVEQMSLVSRFALNKSWQFVGRVTQDLQQKRSLETYAGLQYESCCWAIRLAYHRYINSNPEQANNNNLIGRREPYNSGFVLQFVFKGLAGKASAISTDDMLNTSIFGYKRPYFLNN